MRVPILLTVPATIALSVGTVSPKAIAESVKPSAQACPDYSALIKDIKKNDPAGPGGLDQYLTQAIKDSSNPLKSSQQASVLLYQYGQNLVSKISEQQTWLAKFIEFGQFGKNETCKDTQKQLSEALGQATSITMTGRNSLCLPANIMASETGKQDCENYLQQLQRNIQQGGTGIGIPPARR
jgi:hypothetical protein